MPEALTATLYRTLGQTVTYRTASTVLSIKVILDRRDTVTDAGVSSAGTARVQVADIARPVRGDRINTRTGEVLKVDSVERENEEEWRISLQLCD